MRSPMWRIDASSATRGHAEPHVSDAADRGAQRGQRVLHLAPPRAAQLEPPRPFGRRSRGAVFRRENPSERAGAEHEERVQSQPRLMTPMSVEPALRKSEEERHRDERERDHLEKELGVDHEKDLRGTHPIFRHDQIARGLGPRLVAA